MTTKFLTPADLSEDFIVASDKKVHRVKSDNLGIIHLDFKRTTTANGTILTLPSAAPTPINTLKVQTWDGGNVFIDAGARAVQCSGLSANRRYIIDLVGFFQ